MKILFYLPVVTPWWFENLVVHLIRGCAADAEVHVIVPPIWNNTGIGVEQLQLCLDLDSVQWHIWDADDHCAIRTSAADSPELLALINEIDADYTICRSADIVTPQRFPGQVRFLMEGSLAALPCPPSWVTLRERILEFGVVPPLAPAQRQVLEAEFDPVWQSMTALWRRRGDPAGRAAYCERVGLPADKRIIVLPLEYEHRENFFMMHRPYGNNLGFVREVAERLDDRFVLALTDHPLNRLYAKNPRLDRLIEELGERVRLVPEIDGPRTTTELLLALSDGAVLGDSKTIAAAAFFERPFFRYSQFATAPWMHAYDDLDAFVAAVAAGEARRPSADDTKLWFAYHVSNDIIDTRDRPLTAAKLVDVFEHQVAPWRWPAAAARYQRMLPVLEAA